MASQPKGRYCVNCRFAIDPVEDDNVPSGQMLCQRLPPVLNAERDHLGDYPTVLVNWWCGEWQPANPEAVEEAAAALARLVLMGDMTAARALVDKIKES